jgi:hypothetical protein
MKTRTLSVAVAVMIAFLLSVPLFAAAKQEDVQLTIFELKGYGKPGGTQGGNTVPPQDNSLSNPDYSLLRFHWFSTANYWINPTGAISSKTTSDQVVNVVTTSALTWDKETNANVFNYKGVDTSLNAGNKDGKNTVDWGPYSNDGVIAVTLIWSRGNQILETDLRMNTHYEWSISEDGVSGTMDMQSILTHEFGHWVGLNDLYKNPDYWLTMFGYASAGQTWKQTLGQGDINGIRAFYGGL